MMPGIHETNSILLLKTTCLSEGISSVYAQGIVTSNSTAILSEKNMNNRPNSFDGHWNDLLTSSPFVCDMILISESSPDIFRFPREEILPCGQDNMFVFPFTQGKVNNNDLMFQLGLSNCLWDVNTTFDAFADNLLASTVEVSAGTTSFQWSKGSVSGRHVMTEALITIDLIPAQKLLMGLWHGRSDEMIDDALDRHVANEKMAEPVSINSKERVPSPLQEQSPQISFAIPESVTTPESKRSETCKHFIQYSSIYPRFGKNQIKILQDMVQSELDEIDRLIFFIQVITGLLVVFLGWSLVESTFWPSRPPSSRSSAGIPSSIQPINDEKHDNSFRFESVDASPISMDPSLLQPRHYAAESHGNVEELHKSSKASPSQTFPQTNIRLTPSLYSSNENKGLYLSEALRASKGCASNARKNSMGSSDDRFFVRPVPANVTPDRWMSLPKQSQARTNAMFVHRPVQTIPEQRRNCIAEDCAPGLDENGARLDEIRTANRLSPSEMHDASSFISDYWG